MAQADVSQVVTWNAGFVTSLSEVTNSLNISGRTPFIFGFIEVGVLNATVLKKMVEDKGLKGISGGINIKLDVKVATVEGSAEGAKTDEKNNSNMDTTIK